MALEERGSTVVVKVVVCDDDDERVDLAFFLCLLGEGATDKEEPCLFVYVCEFVRQN